MSPRTSLDPKIVFLVVALFAQALVVAPQQASYKYTPPEKVNDGIRVGNLRNAALDEAKIVSGVHEIRKGTYANIHSLLIFRKGILVFEEYFTGDDFDRGAGPLGVVKHTPDTLHDMRSVTKSIVALAVLKAHSQGKIKSLDQPIFDFFPEYVKHADGQTETITLKHVLTMTSGLDWNEKLSYADPKNSEREMDDSSDPIAYVFSRRLVDKPGSVFNYSGGMTQLLAAVIEKTTGMDVDAFAERHLFTPLGITEYKWVKMESGDPSAASGLRLRSRDMAKLGLLLMNSGRWNGNQILPTGLAREALVPHARAPYNVPGGHVDYGYQIWLPTQTVGRTKLSWAEFEGNGGQIVVMDKTRGILVAVTAGNYNKRDLAKNSADIYSDIVLPALTRRY